ncbi:hypothetical protein EVA_15187, partial [gut metagenome]
ALGFVRVRSYYYHLFFVKNGIKRMPREHSNVSPGMEYLVFQQ